MDYGNSEKRRKRKDKYKEKKKHPYRLGGARRTMSDSKKKD
jgi:hypothetical protein